MKDPRFLIIGAGMSGILTAIKLREAGYHDFVVYEKADRLGGTWRENTYPGIACDVPSHFYRYSFALNPNWSHRFSPGDEIQAYFEDVAKRYDVYLSGPGPVRRMEALRKEEGQEVVAGGLAQEPVEVLSGHVFTRALRRGERESSGAGHEGHVSAPQHQ